MGDGADFGARVEGPPWKPVMNASSDILAILTMGPYRRSGLLYPGDGIGPCEVAGYSAP